VADEFRFVALRAFARPPRLLVVPYVEAEGVHWAAAGLGALSQVWGGCAGAVVPSVVAHASLAGLMRRMQPDHVHAYTPAGATVEAIRPGVIDQMVGDLKGEARVQSEAFVRAKPWHHREALEVEQAAAGLVPRSPARPADRSSNPGPGFERAAGKGTPVCGPARPLNALAPMEQVLARDEMVHGLLRTGGAVDVDPPRVRHGMTPGAPEGDARNAAFAQEGDTRVVVLGGSDHEAVDGVRRAALTQTLKCG
jgi:hypothetical protein